MTQQATPLLLNTVHAIAKADALQLCTCTETMQFTYKSNYERKEAKEGSHTDGSSKPVTPALTPTYPLHRL